MKVALLGKKIFYFNLPAEIDGSFWMSYDNNPNNHLVNIEAYNNQWVMNANDEVKIINGNTYVEKIVLVPNMFYVLEKDNEKILLYTQETFDSTFEKFIVPESITLNIGNDATCEIQYAHGYMPSMAIQITFNGGIWHLNKLTDTILYRNNRLINSESISLENGDSLFICGMKIIVVGKLLLINNPNGQVNIHSNLLQSFSVPLTTNPNENEEVKEKDYYSEDDYFLKSPRLRRFIETNEIHIESPPAKAAEDETPLIYILGPMLATATMSIVNFTNVLTSVLNGETTMAKSWPRLLTAVAMMTTTLLWPNLNKRYKKKQAKKKEEKRQTKYMEYLQKKEKEIDQEMKNQTDILKENLLLSEECRDIILTKARTLWERKLEQKDFLTVRVGIGVIPTDIKVNYSVQEFSLEEDNLKLEVEKLGKKSEYLYNVPVGYSFLNKRITAIMGNQEKMDLFLQNIIVQFLAYHSYDELKIVVLTNEENEHKWSFLKEAPHCFSDDKQIRFFATTQEEKNDLGNFLNQVVKMRKYNDKNEPIMIDYKKAKPYFVIFTDIITEVRKMTAINEILEAQNNIGISLIIVEEKISKLPSRCTNFINLGIVTSDIFENDSEVNNHQTFNDELQFDLKIKECCDTLSNVPIQFESAAKLLPNSLSFLEMFNVGKVEQLNSINRWKMNNPIKSLRGQIGVNDLGDPIYLDLHEKFHGPHGLIAGMTGSGKSEFIITYILSMALNYNPYEVSFILIDYKGGGLVGAFENQKLGLKLPHLAGKITNLDKAEMKRTLVSIESELKRRQTIFNEARDKLGEGTIDIYKYQKFYREGKLEEPVSHLFIISDEFAELKSQQPEFMENLISAARIGRSLGVHLILATQKPSGVVNEQIWSNSKFRVCLKVQDKSDSNEMLKKPDAAAIRQAGRFYLQVGYDEIYVLGQSGWCGAQYFPSDIVKKTYDRSVNLISNIGAVLASAEKDTGEKKAAAEGDQLTNVLKYIVATAQKENMVAKKMWLDSIPEIILADELKTKYNYQPNPLAIEAIVGEYDNPRKQVQHLLTIPLTENGNTLIYSISSTDRERMLYSILYSTADTYSVDDINYYIVDFGAETLRIFQKIPHIGDIVFNGEKEKLTNLFKLIDEELQIRKKKFTEYSGQYVNYIRDSGEKVPLIVVILNDYDAIVEEDDSIHEKVATYTRDCERYGISFVITCNATNSVRTRVKQQFKNSFVLEMNSKEDYTSVVGNWKHVCLFNLPGRGLVKLDDIYEFQTATILEEENFTQRLNEKIEQIRAKNPKSAKKIPVLPEVISIDMLKQNLTDLKNVPIGMARDTLQCVSYNFQNNIGNVIASTELKNCVNFVHILIEEFKLLGNNNIQVIDFDKEFEKFSTTVTSYCVENVNEKLDELISLSESNTPATVVIFEPAKLKQKAANDKITKYFNGLKAKENVIVLFVVSSGRAKEIELDAWYTGLINKQNGIWIGNGIMEQSVFRTATLMRVMKTKLNNSYGWHIKNGNNYLVKLIEEETGDTNE